MGASWQAVLSRKTNFYYSVNKGKLSLSAMYLDWRKRKDEEAASTALKEAPQGPWTPARREFLHLSPEQPPHPVPNWAAAGTGENAGK